MNLKILTSICINFFATLIIFNQPQIDALSHDWVSVPMTQYGEQIWDKKSIQKNRDRSIRVLSKFIPASTTDITQEILYTMDINCSEKSFRDVAVGSKEFNEFENTDSNWKDPKGDKLILAVINQVCGYVN